MSRRIARMTAVALALAGACAGAGDAALVKANAVYTVSGEVLSPGMVLIADGKIVEVGKEIAAPQNAPTYTAEAVVPGFIDAASSIGLRYPFDEESSETTPRVRAADAFDAAAAGVAAARMQGITLARIGPGGRNVYGGLCALVTTYGATAKESIVRDEAALKGSLDPEAAYGNTSSAWGAPTDPFFRRPTTRMALVQLFNETLARAKETLDGTRPKTPDLDVVGRVLTGKLPFHVYTRTAFDLRVLLDDAQRFNIAPVIEGGIEAHKELAGIKARGLAVILTAEALGAAGRISGIEVRATTPVLLAGAGIEVAFAAGDSGLDPLSLGTTAVRYGMDANAALRALTLGPARILKIDDERGSIAAGKVADLVLLSGAPFQVGTRVVQVIGNGKVVVPKGGR